jgi:hypothetical protein
MYKMNELNVKSNSKKEKLKINIVNSTVKESLKPKKVVGIPRTFCIMGLQVFKNSKGFQNP